MRILMVNKFLYPRGGSESYMLYLGDYLKALGHEVEYFGMYDEKNTVGNSAEMYTTNMDFHKGGAASFLYPFKILYSFEAKKKISKVIEKFKPDIVHMNNINFQLTPSIIYGIKKYNIPIVWTVHDYQMVCPNHLLYSFEENRPCERCLNGSVLNCFSHKCIHSSRIKSLLGVMEAVLYRMLKTYKKVDLFVCPSNFLERKLHSVSNIYKNKTYTIHNFINKEKFKKSDKPREDYVLFVGRLSKEKGVEKIARVADILKDVKFVVAGSGPDEDILKGKENVELKGFLTGDGLTDVMARAKALLLPSVCYENCPLSILEAQCMALPVITMNSGGMAELVADGVCGTLAESANAEDIAKAISKTVNDDSYYKMLKENAEKESENIYDIEMYTGLLLKKYTELIKRGKN